MENNEAELETTAEEELSSEELSERAASPDGYEGSETADGETPAEPENTAWEGDGEEYSAAEPVKAGKFRVLSLVLFLLTAGGLFLGLLGNVAAWLSPSYYLGTTILNNSLFGFFATRMELLFTGAGWENVPQALATLAACLLAVSLGASLVCFIVSLASPAEAKRATAFSGTISLLTYTLLFVWACCANSLDMEKFSAAAIDVPVALITLALFVVMTVYSIVVNGGKGFLAAGIYIFVVTALFALFFPGSFTESNLAFLKAYSEHPIYNSVVLATAAIAAVNLIAAIVAFPKQGRGRLMTALFSVQLALIVLLAVTGCLIDETQTFAFFTGSALLPSVVLILATIGALLLSIIMVLSERREREALNYGEAVEEDEASTEAQADGAELYAEAEMPVADVEIPVAEAEEPLAEENTELLPAEDDGPILLSADEAPLPELTAEPVLPELDAEPFAAEYPEEPEAEPEMSAFEREMLSFAEQTQAEPETRQDAPFPPYAQAAPVQQPSYRPVNVYAAQNTMYLYDPFINELTLEEKNEFGDLFIACKSGKFGDLPAYVIGGDNKEFFEKVWIRYGLYDMSQPLRDKLYNYVRKYRNR